MRTLSLAAMLTALLQFGAGTTYAQIGFPPDGFGGPANQGGMMLGIYAVETLHGMRIVDTVDGYSADGRLLPGDILLRATADNLPVFSITTHSRLEYAKAMIGANRVAAIEFFRPNRGNMYAWMTFELQTNQPHSLLMGISETAQTSFTAEFILESEKPGARQLFEAAAVPGVAAPGTAAPAQTPAPNGPQSAPPAAAPDANPPIQSPGPQDQLEQPAQPQLPGETSSTEAAIDALLK